jgi:multidrug efflux pump subunit AcrA (membrane-fusion protein)
MSNDSSRRRAWIKNAAIIFLVILLLLTFFSNTILNYSLPEVSAQYASSGTLSTAIKASGTVKANASYNVVYEADEAEADDGVVQSRKVVSVYVKEGQTVEKDEPILELKGGASEQLEAAQEEYDKLKREYDLAVLGDTVTELTSKQTISDAEKSLEDAKEELTKLQKNYNDLLSGVDTTTIINNQIDSLTETIETLEEQKEELSNTIADVKNTISEAKALIEKDVLSNETVSEKLATAKEEYDAVSGEYETLKKEADFYKEKLDEIKSISGSVTEANTLTKSLATLNDELESLEKEIKRYKEDTLEELDTLEVAADAARVVWENIPKTEAGEVTVEGDGSTTISNESAREAYQAAKSAYEKAKRNYERQIEDYDDKVESLEDQISEIEDKLEVIGMPEVDDLVDYTVDYDLSEAQKNYDDAAAKLTEIETEYTEAKTKYESLIKQSTAEDTVNEYSLLLTTYENEEKSLEDTIKQKNKDLDKLKKQLTDSTSEYTEEELADKIKSQEELIEKSESTLEITKATENQNNTKNDLDREDQKKQLKELEAKIEKYKNAPENTQITAPIAGKITSINFSAGESVSSGNTVASIEIADKGYIVEISMSSEQARKIQVGTPCSVTNSWWYTNIEASVTGMRSDASSQGKNRIITITVTGDVTEGQSLTFSIGDKSQSYDSVLPNSAIREDNDGKFVLVVESKKTPLNMRYTAKRVDIEVLSSDDTQSAVSGLYGSEFVITNSTVPISDKQQVRLAEN